MGIHSVNGKSKPKKKKNQPYYRRLAIKHLGIKKSGGKGWVSLAKLVAEKQGKSTPFGGQPYSKRYVKLVLGKYAL